ncbi:MAG: ATP-binding protein [Alphaproteobacteria bacterium]
MRNPSPTHQGNAIQLFCDEPKVAGLYAEFKVLGDKIITLADRRKSALQAFRNSTKAVDRLLDGKLKPLADRNIPSGTGKRAAVADMDEFIDEIFPLMEPYLIYRDPAARQAFHGARATFDGLVARYREIGLSAEEAGLLDQIEREFSGAMATGTPVMAIVDELHERLERFEADLKVMDALLDDRIQPLIHAGMVRAADEAQAATDAAGVWLLVLGVIALIFGSAAAWTISRTIMGPVHALVAGADAVGGGDLDHKIKFKSKDEFGHLATAFNRMIENLARARQSIEDGRRQLERRVAERTAELTHELAERERAEAALRKSQETLIQAQKLEAVGQLTGGLAHDFNNLLTIVLGNLQLLLRRLDDDDLKEMVFTAEGAARRGAELTHRLLAFGRRQSLEPRVVDLNRLVLGMSDMLRRTLGMTFKIETVVADAVKPTLVDPAQVENAILNLAINARDSMPGGGVLTIRTGARKISRQIAVGGDDVSPGEYVMLAISDTGTGMPPDVAERAFDPFFTTKEVGRGSGLGLSMIYGFCRQSGGFTTIDSEPDQGTTVSLFLPATDAAEEIDATASTGAMDENGHETVLVVEDDPGVRLFAATVLGSLDYNVIEAADGRTALETLESNGKIDVLFTDIQLPGGIDGRDIANQARTRQPDINILFTSGFAVDGENRDLMEITMLRKPYTGEELAAKIRGVIENLDGEKQ